MKRMKKALIALGLIFGVASGGGHKAEARDLGLGDLMDLGNQMMRQVDMQQRRQDAEEERYQRDMERQRMREMRDQQRGDEYRGGGRGYQQYDNGEGRGDDQGSGYDRGYNQQPSRQEAHNLFDDLVAARRSNNRDGIDYTLTEARDRFDPEISKLMRLYMDGMKSPKSVHSSIDARYDKLEKRTGREYDPRVGRGGMLRVN